MLRTTLIRGGLLLAFALVAATLWWAVTQVRPEVVRTAVLQTFEEQFPGGHVHVGEAHLRLFGGVNVRDLTLTRDDGQPIFTARRAVIAHDKERLGSGQMVIRKIELDAPTLRLERQEDGIWTFDGLARPSPADKPVPTFVVNDGTIEIVDKSPGGFPPMRFTEANVTLINDPPPLFLNIKGTALLTVQPRGGTAPIPPVRVELSARLHRLSGEFNVRVAAADLAIGPETIAIARRWQPEAAERLAAFTARAALRAEIHYRPDAPQPMTFDIDATIRDGRFTDPRLPVPAEAIAATIRYREGRLTVENATARLGTCTAEARAESRRIHPVQPIPAAPSGTAPAVLASTVRNSSPAAAPDPLAGFEELFESFEISLRDLTLSDELFDRLGVRLCEIRDRFHPSGVVALGYRFQRSPATGWQRDFELRPTRFRLSYDRFRYPLDNVTGIVKKTVTSGGRDETSIQLTGTGGGQRIDIRGGLTGSGDDPAIDLHISGRNVPLDDRLFEALPKPRHQQALKRLGASGRGDFVAEIKQTENVNLVDTTLRMQVSGGRIRYELFPYPLDDVTGVVTVHVQTSDETRPVKPGQAFTDLPDTDTIALSDFQGRHGSGVVTIKGLHAAVPGSSDRKLTLHVAGNDCPMDDELRAALAGLKLDAVWRTLSPRGNITFAVEVDVMDRAAATPRILPVPFQPQRPPALNSMLTSRLKPAEAEVPTFNPATDMMLTLHFAGPSITPDFFPYDLDEVSGRVRYDGTQVRVEKFTAKHGASKWGLEAGELRFFDDGRIWGNFGRLDVSPFIADQEFLAALPATLRRGFEELNLRGPADLAMRHLVVLTPPDAPALLPAAFGSTSPPPDPDIYWTGELQLHGAGLDAGVAWEQVAGRIACTGRYYGTHLGEVVGNIWVDEALAAGHPVQQVKLAFRADPQTRDPVMAGQWEPVAVRLEGLTGRSFGGNITGEGRVTLSDPVRYRMRLDAVNLSLEALAKHHELGGNSRIEGMAQASVRLETAPDAHGRLTLDGAGTVDVDRARMLNLPFLLPLLKTLKLQAPDKTAFEEAHAVFTIRGDRIHVSHLDLIGDAVSIGGRGETDIRGEHVKFDCYTIWSQTIHRWMTTPFGDLSAFLSEKLFRIEITRGPDGKIRYDARLAPIMTDPMRVLAERVKQRSGRSSAQAATVDGVPRAAAPAPAR